MAITVGLLALLEAKPGKEDDLEAFLAAGREIAEREPGTRVWYAFKVGDGTFGIFDAFDDDSGRAEHLNGRIPAALAEVGPDLLASDPDIRPVDVIATTPS
jgi:quinol monooxygenase YgiN